MFRLTNHTLSSWRARLLMLAPLLFVFVTCSYGQSLARPSPTPPDPTAIPKDDSSNTNFGSPESEMRAKLILKEEKKRYDEHVARAREVSEIATQLVQNYKTRRVFNNDDGKKVERLQKLTKRIRNEAGGSDSDPDADIKDIPADPQLLLKRVAEMADELKEMVEKTPRNVVSAAVIDQANRLLGLVQHLRDLGR